MERGQHFQEKKMKSLTKYPYQLIVTQAGGQKTASEKRKTEKGVISRE